MKKVTKVSPKDEKRSEEAELDDAIFRWPSEDRHNKEPVVSAACSDEPQAEQEEGLQASQEIAITSSSEIEPKYAEEVEHGVLVEDEDVFNPNDHIPIDEHLQGDDDGSPEWLVKVPILPCWDETDDGVPPFCRGDAPVSWWKVFNTSNRYTNDNLIMIAFGNVGFKYFDKKRKYWMGAAMWSTLISIAFTIAGCFALSTNMSIVKNTNWVYVVARDMTTDEVFTVHLGLRSLVYTSEPCNPLHCERTSYHYSTATGSSDWPNAFLDGGLQGCRTIAYGTAFGAFTTCATLLFALMGTMNRMRFSSDANIQKALGMITDLCGFISLASTLLNFGSACWGDINRNYEGFTDIKVWMGPGYACYCVCLFGAFMRALFHWLTPLPGRGSGCLPSLPKSLVKKLDRDGDGKVSWEEMKLGYHELVVARHKRLERKKQMKLAKHQVGIVKQPV